MLTSPCNEHLSKHHFISYRDNWFTVKYIISHSFAKNNGCGYQASMKQMAGQRRAYSDTTLPRRIAVGPTLAWYSLLAGYSFEPEGVLTSTKKN